MRRKILSLLLAGAVLAPTATVYAQDTEVPVVTEERSEEDKKEKDPQGAAKRDAELTAIKNAERKAKSEKNKELINPSGDFEGSIGIPLSPEERFTPEERAEHDRIYGRGKGSLQNITANVIQSDSHGSGALGETVVVIDSGLHSTDSMASRVLHSACFVTDNTCPNGNDSQTSSNVTAANATGVYASGVHPLDVNHGTDMANIIGSNVTTNTRGVAYQASIIPIRVYEGTSGNITLASVVAALEHVDTQMTNGNVAFDDVVAINMSLGFDVFTQQCDGGYAATNVYDVIENLQREHNVLTVVAGGNADPPATNGSDIGVEFPACLTNVISVGATDPANDANRLAFSHISNELTMLAPGIITHPSNGGNVTSTGSSGSAALVSGSIALLQTGSGASAAYVRLAMTSTGTVVNLPGGIVRRSLDVLDAVNWMVTHGTYTGSLDYIKLENPIRLEDTRLSLQRNGPGWSEESFGTWTTIRNGIHTLDVSGPLNNPQFIRAAVLNVQFAGTNEPNPGFMYFNAWPSGTAQPGTSFLTFPQMNGSAVNQYGSNAVIVQPDANGFVDWTVHDTTGNRYANIIIEVVGYLDVQSDATIFNPVRTYDSRATGPLEAAWTTYTISDLGVGTSCAGADKTMIMNVTVISQPAGGFMTFWEQGTYPNVTHIQWNAYENINVQVVMSKHQTNATMLYLASTQHEVIVDVVGCLPAGTNSTYHTMQPPLRKVAGTTVNGYTSLAVDNSPCLNSEVAQITLHGNSQSSVNPTILSAHKPGATGISTVLVWPNDAVSNSAQVGLNVQQSYVTNLAGQSASVYYDVFGCWKA